MNLLTKSDKKTACIKDGCKLKDFLTCYYSGNGSCVVWEKAQDRKSCRMMLEWGTGNCTNPEHFGFKSHQHRFKCLECMAELEEKLK